MSEEMLAYAAASGFTVERSERVNVDPAAARMLRVDSFAVPVALAGGVLEVLVDHVPTPAEFASLERASGLRVAVTVTSSDLLARARTRALAQRTADIGRTVRSLWVRTRFAKALGLSIVAGQPPALMTAAGPMVLPDEPPVSAEESAHWREDILGAASCAVVPDGDDMWRVNAVNASGLDMLSMRRLPTRVWRADELGLPSVSATLVAPDSGLVLVAGPPGSGRSSAAVGLADWAISLHARSAAVIGRPVERPLPSRLSTTWAISVGVDASSVADAVSSSLSAGARILVIDVPDDPAGLHAAARAAAAGALVFVVSESRDTLTALQALVAIIGGQAAATVFAGAVSCRLLSDSHGEPVPVFEVVTPSPGVRAAITSNTLMIPAAVEAAGSSAGMTLETALATAVSAGRLSPETARAAAIDVQRFEVASGRMHSLMGGSEDLDMDLLE